MLQDAVKRHYVALFGAPSRTAEFKQAGQRVEIYKWDEECTSLGVALYATIGASSHPLPGFNVSHREEFIIGLRPPEDSVAPTLAAVAVHTAFTGEALAHGHTLSFDHPLWDATAMRSVVIIQPGEEVVQPLAVPNGLHVVFLMAVPLFPAELAFKRRHGADALLDEWEKQGIRFSDPNRTEAALPKDEQHSA